MTIIVVVFVLSLLLWEHLQGGIVSHHLLARKDMPKISNWWGVLVVPIMTWILLSLIKKNLKSSNDQKSVSNKEIYGFIGAFIFGATMTILFYNAPELPGYFMLMTFVLALFIPIYRHEYYLGFILSMTYGFGGVLPVLFGLVLIPVYWIEYRFVRKGFLYVLQKIR